MARSGLKNEIETAVELDQSFIKQGARRYRRLMSTDFTLASSEPAIIDHAKIHSYATARTANAIGPGSALQCRIALLLDPRARMTSEMEPPSWHWTLF